MQCPGQDSRFWDGTAVFEANCPDCGQQVEFFKDDSSRNCTGCGRKMLNPRLDFGCAQYCPYAEQCLGTMPPALLAKKQEALKEHVAVAMKKYFRADFRRIGHALRVARYAEQITEALEAADGVKAHPAIVQISAYLHDIGIKEAEAKYQSTAPKYQHREGPTVARAILTELGAQAGLIEEVCDIVGHHHYPRKQESINFKVLYDADLITNLEEKQKTAPTRPEHLEKIIARSFMTRAGQGLAGKVLRNEES